MKQAIWNGTIIAESAETVVVEGNHYFPAETVNKDYLTPSDKTSFCGWKGDCNYHNVVVDRNESPAAAWYYADPYERAEKIRGHIAFWKGVEVLETNS